MAQQSTTQRSPKSPAPARTVGRDEMNLAEFPIGKLGVRDDRESLTYSGWYTDKTGKRFQQKWVVSGSKEYGLPHELGNRILVVFITLAAERQSRQVFFVDHQMLKLLRLSRGQANYRHFERNLLQLAGLTIYSEQAFWDHAQQRRITTKRAFHIFEDVWLSSWTGETHTDPRGHGYVLFNDVFWRNIESGYLKTLNLDLYLGTLQSATARQLYRCLDKLMRYRSEFTIDIFDLAGRIGLQQYAYPSKVKEKLDPAIRELTASGFLASVDYTKSGPYTRVHFVKGSRLKPPEPAAAPGPAAAETATRASADAWPEIAARYAVDADARALWAQVLAGLQARVRPLRFDGFVERTLLHSIVDGTATILVGNPQALDWLRNRFAKQFQDELNYHLRQAGRPPVTAVKIAAITQPQP